MTTRSAEEIRAAVRDRYGKIATEGERGCGCGPTCCDDSQPQETSRAARMGYAETALADLPAGANMGLGCGNPNAIAGLREGETVLDLGSGGGIDCFLAAREVGPAGFVIGVDMTPEMVAKARRNAVTMGATNVSFRLGEIEHLPVESGSVDVVMSNCVINLSPDKPQVYREAFRVLRPGGRLAVADVVVVAAPLPEALRHDLGSYAGCVSGAVEVSEITHMLEDAGFADIRIRPQDESRELVREWSPGTGVEQYVVSAIIEARKAA